MKLAHFFLPHPETHKKAHLLSASALLVYIAFFIVLQFSFSLVNKYKPGVLGITSSANQKELISLTNKERQKMGLSDLVEDERLDRAASEKAKNMFEENYWAHYSPSGKDPWGFILNSGYNFTFAGENLARNFYSSDDIVKAWMASPTHRENIINPRYKNIGMAVLEGELNGQKTVLIVQEFGSPVEALANNLPNTDTKNLADNNSNLVADVKSAETSKVVLTDNFIILKTLGLILLGFLAALILVDIYIMKKRMVFRTNVGSRLSHLAILSLATSLLWNVSPGSIL